MDGTELTAAQLAYIDAFRECGNRSEAAVRSKTSSYTVQGWEKRDAAFRSAIDDARGQYVERAKAAVVAAARDTGNLQAAVEAAGLKALHVDRWRKDDPQFAAALQKSLTAHAAEHPPEETISQSFLLTFEQLKYLGSLMQHGHPAEASKATGIPLEQHARWLALNPKYREESADSIAEYRATIAAADQADKDKHNARTAFVRRDHRAVSLLHHMCGHDFNELAILFPHFDRMTIRDIVERRLDADTAYLKDTPIGVALPFLWATSEEPAAGSELPTVGS
jgi:hypothetical protein